MKSIQRGVLFKNGTPFSILISFFRKINVGLKIEKQ